MVRFGVLIFFLGLAAQADFILWSPAGQNVTYILPEDVKPDQYLMTVKTAADLAPFVAPMQYSKDDKIEVIKPDTILSKQRVLLVANSIEDQSSLHPRVNNLGRHFNQIFVLPVGSTFKLGHKKQEKFLTELAEHFNLFIFMGGEDKDPGLYGEPHRGADPTTNRLLDLLEQRIIRFLYFKTSVKIFGICRGLQHVFTSLGGKLNQDIKTNLATSENHSGGTFHKINLSQTKNGILANMIKGLPQDYVDSHHHQSAREDSVTGTVFEVSARSPEGVIEGLESRDGRIFLVQFHPEMLDNKIEYISLFFQRLRGWIKEPAPSYCRKFF